MGGSELGSGWDGGRGFLVLWAGQGLGRRGENQAAWHRILPMAENSVILKCQVGCSLGARWRELTITECPLYFPNYLV